jgi:predicted metal-dependent phosphoesterase TrpH
MNNMMPLKVDLHIHTKEDGKDRISYSARELIDEAVLEGFDAVAITNHDTLTFSPELAAHADERGIVLIPGVEACIKDKHILLLNMPFERHFYTSFEDVLKQKTSDSLVIAPHPYFPGPTSLDGTLEAMPNLFDAVEYSCFHTPRIDFNRPAVRFAEKHGLPIVGNSDAHQLAQLGLAYSLVEAEKTLDGIVQAIKAGRVRPVSPGLPANQLVKMFFGVLAAKPISLTWIADLTLMGAALAKQLLFGRS